MPLAPQITVGSKLYVSEDELDPAIVRQIVSDLTVINPHDQDARIDLLERTGGILVMPRGYAMRLHSLMLGKMQWIDARVTVPPSAPIPQPTSFVQPRDYQQRAVHAMLTAEQGIYNAGTASGKTISSAIFCAAAQQRTLIIVDKINLATQWQERFQSALGVTPTIIGDGRWEESDITIATRQTLWAKRDELDDKLIRGGRFNWWETWGAVIIDECLPAGVQIMTPDGSSPIESLREGDLVIGVDEEGREIVTPVLKTFENVYKGDLIEVGGVPMTPNHPVYTLDRGYVRADKVFDSAMLYHDLHGRTQTQENMRAMPEGIHGMARNQQVLLSELFKYEHRPTADQPVQVGKLWRRDQKEVASNEDRERLRAPERRQWNGADNTTNSCRTSNGVGDRVCCGDGQPGQRGATHSWDPSQLQDRRCVPGIDDRGGDRWSGASIETREGAGRAEGCVAETKWVDSVALLESRGRPQSRQCSEGNSTRVFNIETGTGNYFADGLLVHNCHAISAPTVREVMQKFPARYRIGITATPDRHNWLMAASRGIIGEIICRTSEEELRDAGVLVTPRVIAVRTPFHHKSRMGQNSNTAWTAMIKALKIDQGRNMMIGQILAAERGSTMIVQTDHTTHADLLYGLAVYSWPENRVGMLTGKQSGKQRDEIRRKAEEGDYLIISTIGKEALDIPRLDRYMIAFPTRNATATKQMIGRVKRVHEDKIEPPIIYDIYDHHVPRLVKQFQERRGVYAREGIPIEFTGEPPITAMINAQGS